MAHRVFCLADWDHQPKRKVIVAYKAGWVGLVPNAALLAAPAGVFQETGKDGDARKP